MGFGVQWHQLDRIQTICTTLPTDNHTSTSSLDFYRLDALHDAQPTVSKHWRHSHHLRRIGKFLHMIQTRTMGDKCNRFYSCASSQSTKLQPRVSTHWRKLKALGHNDGKSPTGLNLSPPSTHCSHVRKGRCSIYAGSDDSTVPYLKPSASLIIT